MTYAIIATNSDQAKSYFLVHDSECKDVSREVKKFNGRIHLVGAKTAQAAIDLNLNEFYTDNGYNASHYSIARCCK